ncbi:MAG: DUF4351 domain-containing protein [Magnetococcales bacterium]|nr:DUF4351 domain-containing protein [Magnetococcales bacterium]MBF0115737.1 DUF4351 domain-containing protein [Magnetococcales bacterium]
MLRLLQRRFGQLPDTISAKVMEAKLESLDVWSDRILDANTLDDVFAS